MLNQPNSPSEGTGSVLYAMHTFCCQFGAMSGLVLRTGSALHAMHAFCCQFGWEDGVRLRLSGTGTC